MRAKRTKYTLRSDGRVMMTKTINGKRVAFYGKNDKEVERKYAEHIRQEKSAQKPTKNVRTFEACADDWWEEKEPELAPISVRIYKSRCEDVKAYFKDTPVTDVTAAKIIAFLRRMQAQNYSQKSINSRRSVIKAILDNALIAGEIPFNPCVNLPIIKGKPENPRLPATDDDLRRIETHKSESDIARMFHFIMWTGCRRGEAAALQEKNIDRTNGTAHICQTLTYSSPTPIIKGSPKTQAGVRDVVVPAHVFANIPQYADPNTFVFFPHGLPKERRFRRMIDNYRSQYGIKSTLHQLRHSYATMLHSAGVDVKDAQYLLGHASVVITQDIYTAIDKRAKSKMAVQISQFTEALSKVLSEPANGHES